LAKHFCSIDVEALDEVMIKNKTVVIEEKQSGVIFLCDYILAIYIIFKNRFNELVI
jgi:hypothetical protein